MASAAQELWNANALWPGQAIAERLRAQVEELRAVLLVDDFDPSLSVPKQLPSALVILDALRVNSSNVLREAKNCEQDWMVALAVRTARSAADAQSAAIGVLMPKVVLALQGYVPTGSLRGFIWRTGPRPSFGKDVSYYPLIFSLQVVTA